MNLLLLPTGKASTSPGAKPGSRLQQRSHTTAPFPAASVLVLGGPGALHPAHGTGRCMQPPNCQPASGEGWIYRRRIGHLLQWRKRELNTLQCTQAAAEGCAGNKAGECRGTCGQKRVGRDQDLPQGLHEGVSTEAEMHVCFKIIQPFRCKILAN